MKNDEDEMELIRVFFNVLFCGTIFFVIGLIIGALIYK